MQIHSYTAVMKAIGSFWDLHNRIKMRRVEGLLVISCSELALTSDSLFDRVDSLVTIQNPGGLCRGNWHRVAEELASASKPIGDVVHLHHPGCRFQEGSSPEEHALRQLRALVTVEPLATAMALGKLRLHSWMTGKRGELLVLHRTKGVFLSPLHR